MSAALNKMAQSLHRHLGKYLNRCECSGQGGGAIKTSPHAGELEALVTLLTGLGHQNMVEPLLMLEVFLASGEHLTVASFVEKLKERGHEVSEEKASEALKLFTSLGFAAKNFTEDGRGLYEHTRPGLHHDHLICSGCGRTVEFNRPDVDGLIEKIACDENFHHLDHRLIVYGLCPACRRRRCDGLALSETKAGETVVVIGFNGSDELKHCLRGMGLRRWAHLKILGEQSGSIIVLFDGCRLALGPELASNLMVRATGRKQCAKPGFGSAHNHGCKH